MWQRIQTLWLLLAGVAMTLTFIFPIVLLTGGADIEGANQVFNMTSVWVQGKASLGPEYTHWYLFALTTIIIVLSFLTIFLFKRRRLQMRLCTFIILLTLGYIGYFGFLAYQYNSQLQTELSIKPLAALLPIASVILLILAYRGIRRDDILVRVSNRIR